MQHALFPITAGSSAQGGQRARAAVTPGTDRCPLREPKGVVKGPLPWRILAAQHWRWSVGLCVLLLVPPSRQGGGCLHSAHMEHTLRDPRCRHPALLCLLNGIWLLSGPKTKLNKFRAANRRQLVAQEVGLLNQREAEGRDCARVRPSRHRGVARTETSISTSTPCRKTGISGRPTVNPQRPAQMALRFLSLTLLLLVAPCALGGGFSVKRPADDGASGPERSRLSALLSARRRRQRHSGAAATLLHPLTVRICHPAICLQP